MSWLMQVDERVDYFRGVFTGSVFDLETTETFEMNRAKNRRVEELYQDAQDSPSKMRKLVQFNVLFNSDYLSLHEFIEAYKALDCPSIKT